MSTELTSFGMTDVGRRRDHNEDAILHHPPVFAVADGVGGAAKGEVASALALEAMRQASSSVLAAPDEDGARAAMESAIRTCNETVHAAQAAAPERAGMATTLTAAVVRPNGRVVVGHVGDSRAYVIDPAGTSRQLTEDHSLVGEMVRAGQLTPAEARDHPQRNVITRALGSEADVSVDVLVEQLLPGEWLLLCSDGLTGHVHDPELVDAVLDAPDPEIAARELVDLANERGGTDNISVVLVRPLRPTADTPLRHHSTTPTQRSVEISGELDVVPIDAVDAHETGDGTAADAHPHDPGWLGDRASEIAPTPARRPPRRARRASTTDRAERAPAPGARTLRRVLLATFVAVVAFVAGGLAWHQSYFLLERPDGAIGIDQGFPVFGLHREYKTSDVHSDDLDPDDRATYATDHTLRDREDAEKLFERLPELAGRCDTGAGGAGDPGRRGAATLQDPNC